VGLPITRTKNLTKSPKTKKKNKSSSSHEKLLLITIPFGPLSLSILLTIAQVGGRGGKEGTEGFFISLYSYLFLKRVLLL